jgi:hypothetical protein
MYKNCSCPTNLPAEHSLCEGARCYLVRWRQVWQWNNSHKRINTAATHNLLVAQCVCCCTSAHTVCNYPVCKLQLRGAVSCLDNYSYGLTLTRHISCYYFVKRWIIEENKNCAQSMTRIRLYTTPTETTISYLFQGRIKLFGAPRQWKNFRPLFQAVFLSWGGGGDITPRLSQTQRLPVPRQK